MNTTTNAARARLHSADPASTLPVPDPRDVTAQAMLERILAAPASGAPARHGRPRKCRLVMAGVVAVTAAAALAVGVVAMPWSRGHPAAAAYAVAKHADGSVSVTVHWDELLDPAALNAELARRGARTVVMPRSAEGQCTTGFATEPAHSDPVPIDFVEHPELRDPTRFKAYLDALSPWIDYVAGSGDGAVFTIHPDKIPAGDTLLIPYEFVPSHPTQASRTPLGFTSMLVPEVPACVPSDADSVYTRTGVQVR
jgi:hypothetical protein